jgi:hypothetical protein
MTDYSFFYDNAEPTPINYFNYKIVSSTQFTGDKKKEHREYSKLLEDAILNCKDSQKKEVLQGLRENWKKVCIINACIIIIYQKKGLNKI